MPKAKKTPGLSKSVKTLLKEGDKLLDTPDLSIEELQSFLDKRDVLLNAFQDLPEDDDTHEFKDQLRQLFLQGEAMLVRLLKMSDELTQTISEVSRQKQAIEKYKFPIVDTEQYTWKYANEDDSNGFLSLDDLTEQPSTHAESGQPAGNTSPPPDGEHHHTDRHC